MSTYQEIKIFELILNHHQYSKFIIKTNKLVLSNLKSLFYPQILIKNFQLTQITFLSRLNQLTFQEFLFFLSSITPKKLLFYYIFNRFFLIYLQVSKINIEKVIGFLNEIILNFYVLFYPKLKMKFLFGKFYDIQLYFLAPYIFY